MDMPTDTFLVIGDPHFKLSNRMQMDVVVDECERVARERRPSCIVCLGDVLDRFSTIREEPLNQALKFFHRMVEIAPFIVLVGNHDRPNNATFCTDEHPFNAVKFWDKPITIVDVPYIWTSPLTSKTYTFVPYVPNGRFADALALPSAAGWQASSLLFAHQDFHGAVYNALPSTTGDVWDGDLPWVVSGHIHDYQTLGTNIVYPGSPIQHASNERADKTLMWITVTSSAGAAATNPVFERVPIHVPLIHVQRVHATDAPTFVLPALPPRSVVKIVLEGTVAELAGFNKWACIKAWRTQGIVVQPHVLPSDPAADGGGEGGIGRQSGDPNAPPPTFRALMAQHLTSADADPDVASLWTSLLTQIST
jgi:DNA repair exonuclease SbcCD nuclease subunit